MVSDFHLSGSTGYGYDDDGRDVLEQVYADVFGEEDCLVRNQIISGTHAISISLLASFVLVMNYYTLPANRRYIGIHRYRKRQRYRVTA